MPNSSPNPVYAVAQRDYRPDHAWVNSAVIRAMPRPAELHSAGGVLAGTAMAERPVLFCAYLIAMNVLNYQFWAKPEGNALVRYQHNGQTGALAMQAAFQAWWGRHLPASGTDLARLQATVDGMRAELVEDDGIQNVFGNIPNAHSRYLLLNEVLDTAKLYSVAVGLGARVTVGGTLSWGDAQWLAGLFPRCYKDAYLKKAQLTLMLMAYEYRSAGVPVALDVSAAADYQLPKVLRAQGLIGYSESLAEIVDSGRLLPTGHPAERAIRAVTVLAVQALSEHFEVSAEVVDFWLWANRNAAKDAQFHLTETTDY